MKTIKTFIFVARARLSHFFAKMLPPDMKEWMPVTAQLPGQYASIDHRFAKFMQTGRKMGALTDMLYGVPGHTHQP